MGGKRKEIVLNLLKDPFFDIHTTDEAALSRYDQALTHSSSGKPDNERLEFFGDCVLDFIIARELFGSFDERAAALKKEFPKLKDEALLTDMLHGITNDVDLSEKVMKIKPFDDAIRRGGGQALNESIRAGAFEAFIAAMLVDQGPEITQTVVSKLFKEEIRNSNPIMSWKNKLQQYIQEQEKTARVQEIIKYQTCREEGTPDHAARHISTVSVRVVGKPWDPWGTGHGRKGKDAEMAAAKEAFETHCKK